MRDLASLPCGLTKELIDTHGLALTEAVGHLRSALPPHAILVGQNIAKDVQWLGLVEGKDFASMIDLAGVWRVWNPKAGRARVASHDAHWSACVVNQ